MAHVSNHGKDSNDDWVPMGATTDSAGNPATNSVVAEIGYTEGVLDAYNETLTSLAAGGPNDVTVTATGLNKYTRWMFEVTGITIDQFNLQVSLDETGSVFPNSQFLAVAPVGVAKAPQAAITANGVYFAVSDCDTSNAGPGNIFFNSLFLDRTGATDDIVVRVLGRV